MATKRTFSATPTNSAPPVTATSKETPMPSREDAHARRMRAFNMADRMHQMGNYPAENVWLAEAKKYSAMIHAIDAHPAGKGSTTTEPAK
jgi:hypothetical protein